MHHLLALLLLFPCLALACLSMKSDFEGGIPVKTACRSCAMNLITVTTANAGGKPMQSDTINKSGTCATRTMVCTGAAGQTTIEINAGAVPTIQDTNGVVTVILTCNAAGTEWQLMGAPITQAECAAPP